MRQLLRRIREHHLLFEWRQDWRDVVHLPRRDYNWYTFHPFLWELEWDRAAPGVEMTLMLLGVGFRVRWNFDWSGTELQAALDSAVDENGVVDMDKGLETGDVCPYCGDVVFRDWQHIARCRQQEEEEEAV